ncbi:hypothetical protein HDU92_002280 [Lobulomyces angularis]|nr:hypothetical protein HDU92_002280 [Lobulomyces angularis]
MSEVEYLGHTIVFSFYYIFMEKLTKLVSFSRSHSKLNLNPTAIVVTDLSSVAFNENGSNIAGLISGFSTSRLSSDKHLLYSRESIDNQKQNK